MTYALAIDIGGTFTDSVLIRDDGQSWTDKTLTTHHNLLEGFFRAADSVMEHADIELKNIDDVIVHATTIVTNVLIERKGPPTGLILTKGFSDTLYIRDEHRYDMFDPLIEYAPPLIPKERTWVVDERTFSDGEVSRTVDKAAIHKLAVNLKEQGVESVGICLLNSYVNPKNEQDVRAYLNEVAPEILVTLSSDIAPQMREYERTSTTAVNAYSVPITKPYLEALTDRLKEGGANHDPFIMLSNGGVLGARTAGKFPVRMIESGPAAGALVAAHIASRNDIDALISFDMGGTTAKACLIQNGDPLVVGTFEVDRQYLFKPGSGMPVTVPSVDMIEIGAGGGSIARIDELGLLKVGPDSAGSNPGPACYDRGGEHVCVTDADLVLGILDPDNFLGGDMPLNIENSKKEVAKLASKLKVAPEQTAWGVFSVVGESMAAAARAHATERGVNYRGLPMLAFGGAGPVHACYVADRIESSKVIYPPMASVLSAYGTLVSPARLDLVRGHLSVLGHLDWSNVDIVINEMKDDCFAAMQEAGAKQSDIVLNYSADMRYTGQQNEITVLFNGDPRDNKDVSALRKSFEAEYEKLYGVRLNDMGVEVVSWRVTAMAGAADRTVKTNFPKTAADPKTHREVYIEDSFLDVPVYSRDALSQDQVVDGPVIVEERETTVFILPGWTLSVDTDGSLIATNNKI